jgi:hypothetical protein
MNADTILTDKDLAKMRSKVRKAHPILTRVYPIALIASLIVSVGVFGAVLTSVNKPSIALMTVGMVLLAVATGILRWGVMKKTAATWAKLYSDVHLQTLAGEQVVCNGANYSGSVLRISFEDGEVFKEYPLSYLCNQAGQRHIDPANVSASDQSINFVNMCKIGWRTSGGEGVIRSISSKLLGETTFLLKLNNGETVERKIGQLTPVRVLTTPSVA